MWGTPSLLSERGERGRKQGVFLAFGRGRGDSSLCRGDPPQVRPHSRAWLLIHTAVINSQCARAHIYVCTLHTHTQCPCALCCCVCVVCIHQVCKKKQSCVQKKQRPRPKSERRNSVYWQTKDPFCLKGAREKSKAKQSVGDTPHTLADQMPRCNYDSLSAGEGKPPPKNPRWPKGDPKRSQKAKASSPKNLPRECDNGSMR